MKFLVSLLCTVVLAGCAAIGPNSPEFPALVQAGVPSGDGQAKIFGTAYWYPNTKGFAAQRSAALTEATNPIPGVLAVTETSLVFMQWNGATKAFEPIKRIAYRGLRGASLDSYGLNRRLVVQRSDYSSDSFDYSRAGGNIVDGEKTEQAVQFVAAKITAIN